MKLHKTIKQMLSSVSEDTILKSMGYQSKVGKKTLHNFLGKKNIYCWLKDGHYDLRYSSETFLFGLVKALDIPPEDYQPEIEKAKARYQLYSKAKQPVIYAETHFKRTTQNIFALMFASSKKYIHINKEEFIYKDNDYIFEKVGEKIRKHFASSNGTIPIMGAIEFYSFTHTNGVIYKLDTKGRKC